MSLLRVFTTAVTFLVLTGCAAVQQDVRFQSAGLETNQSSLLKANYLLLKLSTPAVLVC